MLRIRALNDDSSSEDELEVTGSIKQTTTKEAQESEAFTLYNQALSEQRQGELSQAKDTLLKLLKSPMIRDAPEITEDVDIATHPGLVLKYSSLKNLANICVQQDKLDSAVEYFLQAVMVDATDVTVWYKIGTLALRIHQYSLARHAFEQGLQCNNRHWPCLDHVIPVLFALNNYEVCLRYISKALERDPDYKRGKAFMERIFVEQPSLRRDSLGIFEQCDPVIYEEEVDQDDAEEMVSEALAMREKKRQLAKLPDPPTVTFMQPLAVFSWYCLGQRLVELYDSINTALQARGVTDISLPRVTLGCRVDLSRYANMNPEQPMPHTVAMASQAAPVLPRAPVTPPAGSVGGPSSPGRSIGFGESPNIYVIDRGSRDVDSDTGSAPGKRGPKRKRLLIDDPAGKRRSTRVRNPLTRKKVEEVNYQELLRRILPPTLLYREESDNEMEDAPPQDQPMDLSLGHPAEEPSNESKKHGESAWVSEHLDVHRFISNHQVNSGVLDLFNEFLIEVSSKSRCKWPDGLTTVHLECYNRLRKHFDYPDFLCKDVTDQRIRNMGLMCVVAGEIQVDKWTTLKNRASTPTNLTSSPSRNAGGATLAMLGQDFPGPYLPGDLDYLAGLSCFRDILGDSWQQFAIRVYWLKANLLILQNQMEYCLDCFNRIIEYLKVSDGQSDSAPCVVHLPNCQRDNVVSLEHVQKKQDTLKRCQSLDEVQRLYDASEYSRVVDLLVQSLGRHRSRVIEMESSERQAQLLLLQESLLKMHDYKRCLYWGEVALNEALQKYSNALTKSVREEWSTTIIQLFESLNKCMSSEISVVESLPGRHLVRLCQNLIKVVEICMDSSESVNTWMPWILLYKLARSEEARLQSIQGDLEHEEGIPSSIMLLTIAHEHLGRRSWCLSNSGSLLMFIIETFMAELAEKGPEEQHPHSEELEENLAQCFYCLYGYPSKRKPKYLQDHDIVDYQMPLTWKQSIPVFEFFKPKAVPEFDSYKTSTVSAELEDLLRRIVSLIPDKHNPAIHTEPIRAYIEGDLTQPPPAPQVDIPVVKEIYYLLADYYFKNKETQKAIRFYMHDLSVNPKRFDSWAGMALARASKLEQKLNSLELKAEAPIQKQAVSALRCFMRALDLDDTNSKLWVEHGSLAYQLHSHASRQAKQRRMYQLSEEAASSAAVFSRKMLQKVDLCYTKASDCDAEDNEEWLHHYMLGKVAEKMRKPPKHHLAHYKEAGKYLHDYRAKYPRKIPYYTPPHFAVEALEVFFRLHVCVIKVLMAGADKVDDLPYDMLEEYITQAASGPFIRCAEKKQRRNTERSEPEDNELANLSQMAAPESSSTPKRKGKLSLPDHNYSKHKFSSESSEQSSQESLDASHESLPASSSLAISSPPIITHSLQFPITERRTWPGSGSEGSLPAVPPSGGVSTKDKPDDSGEKTESKPVAPPSEQKPRTSSFSTSFSMDNILRKDNSSPAADSIKEENQSKPVEEQSQAEASIKEEPTMEVDDASVAKMPLLTPDAQQQQQQQQQSSREQPLEPLTVQVDDNICLPDPMDTDQPPTLSPIEEALASFERERLKQEMEESGSEQMEVKEGEKEREKEQEKEQEEKSTKEVFEAIVKQEPSEANEGPKDGGKSVSVRDKDVDETAGSSKERTKCTDAAKETEEKKTESKASGAPLEDANKEKTATQGKEGDEEKNAEEEGAIKTEKTDKDAGGEGKEKDGSKKDAEKVKDPPLVRYKRLMDACIASLQICLSRFPQHYKSLYRLAYIYYHSPHYRNLDISCDLLLSSPQWQQLPHMPCPGLFHDRKISNLFQGLWKIPIEEIDRSGSFASHLAKPLLLLFDILRDKKDPRTLLTIHNQLAKTPDLGKKYLREVDRDYLSRLAYERCLDALQFAIKDMETCEDEAEKERFMLLTYRICQHGSKKMHSTHVNKLLSLAFVACCKDQVNLQLPFPDQAVRYCQQLMASRSTQPTTPGGSTASTPGSMPSLQYRPDGSTFQHQTSIGSNTSTPMLESSSPLFEAASRSGSQQPSASRPGVPPLQPVLSTGFVPKLDLKSPFPPTQPDTPPTSKSLTVQPVLSSSSTTGFKSGDGKADTNKPEWESLDSSLEILASIASVVSTQATMTTKAPSTDYTSSSKSLLQVRKASDSPDLIVTGVKSGSTTKVCASDATRTVHPQNIQSWTGSSSQKHVSHGGQSQTKQFSTSYSRPQPHSSQTLSQAAAARKINPMLRTPTVIPGIRPLPGTGAGPSRYTTSVGAASSVAVATRPVAPPRRFPAPANKQSSDEDSDCIIILSSQESDEELP